ncbi:MAG: hypothetical protein R2857_01915 [Vampirovibrionales bacterium]
MGSVAESIASSRVKAAIPASGFWGIRIARSSSVINIVTNLSVITHVFSIVLKKRLKGARALWGLLFAIVTGGAGCMENSRGLTSKWLTVTMGRLGIMCLAFVSYDVNCESPFRRDESQRNNPE